MGNPFKELRVAITDGDVDRAVELLDQGIPMTVWSFLHATETKRYKILDYFLQHGWDINTDFNSAVSSCIVYAFDDIELLQWFLDHGADPNKRCIIRDCTPLSYAVQDASFEVIQLLFRHGGSIRHGQLLHYASSRSHPDNLEVLKYIYDKDPEFCAMNINKLLDQDSPQDFLMNYRTGLGTPLLYAALTGSLECVKFLMEKGSDPWIKDPYRKTALSYAIHANHEPVIVFLENLRDTEEGQGQGNTQASITI